MTKKRLLSNEIQIEPLLQEGWQQKRGICIYFFSMLSCRCESHSARCITSGIYKITPYILFHGFSCHPAIRRGSMYFFVYSRGLRPCLLAAALTGSHFPSTEPAQQAQSHCCASAQQSHLSIRSNLTAAQPQSHFAPQVGRNKIAVYRPHERFALAGSH